jgi:hypothetical protein
VFHKPFIPSIPYLFLTSTRRAAASYDLCFLLEAKGDIGGAVKAIRRSLKNDPETSWNVPWSKSKNPIVDARLKLNQLLKDYYEDSESDLEGTESDSD